METRHITDIYDNTHHLGYDYVYSITEHGVNSIENVSHAHEDFYEIIFFLSGDTQFHIEGNIYKSKKHDIYIARPFELHRLYYLSDEPYERVVIFLMKDFFTKNHCEELERFFLDQKPGMNCHIPAHIVNREMYQLIMKINRYLQEEAYDIASCVMMEFLYLLNRIREPLTEPVVEDTRIQKILLYINDHLEEEINLDTLSAAFYINKYHLCRLFKSVTSYTINQYITYKRLVKAIEYHRQGQSLLDASMNAGFNTYSHFYKAYRKTYGTSPREVLNKK